MSQASAPTARSFHVLAKPVGPLCNLDCTYCYYLEKERLYPGRATKEAWAMSAPVLESFVRQQIQAQPSPVVHFAWQGGEPTLLGVDYFRKVVELQKRHAGGRRVENALQTNGALLDDEWADFLAANGFLVGISIDGPREHHDRYRLFKGGQPSFDAAMRGLSLLKKHGASFNTLTVASRENARDPLGVYRFLREIGSTFMQLIPLVERLLPARDGASASLAGPDAGEEARVSPWSVEPGDWGRFLCAIFDEWVRHDVGRVFVQSFDVALESWTGRQPSLCLFRETCGDALAIEHNGDLYSCDHFVYPEHRLGNVSESPLLGLAGSAKQIRFGLAKRDTLPAYCRNCEVRFACNGECPKHRFIRTPDGEPGLNYLCAGYKLFFRHVDPYMKFMAEELKQQRPPANVMAWARSREPGTAQPRRTEPCSCGSGRIYKKCCGRAAGA